MVQNILKAGAYFGVLLAGFPLAVAFQGMGYERFSFWVFAAITACCAAFGCFGMLVTCLLRRWRDKKKRGKNAPFFMQFVLNSSLIIPLAAFIAATVIFKVNALIYLYILPLAIAMYYKGSKCAGRSYTDIFTKGWVVLYVLSALFTIILFALYKNNEAGPEGNTLLCAGFAVMIILSAVLSNQTSIDTNTRRRSSRGNTILPYGMRSYNALLVTGLFAVTLGLFVFAPQIGSAITAVFSAIVGAFLKLMEFFSGLFFKGSEQDEVVYAGEGGVSEIEPSDSPVGTIITFLFPVIAIILAIKFRRQVFDFLKFIFGKIFKRKKFDSNIPYSDEVFASDRRQKSEKAKLKAERDLLKRYRRETDPALRYRLGYALYLRALSRTESPPAPSDTCADHRAKGESAFQLDLKRFTDIYSGVRYGEAVPNPEELSDLGELLKQISLL